MLQLMYDLEDSSCFVDINGSTRGATWGNPGSGRNGLGATGVAGLDSGNYWQYDTGTDYLFLCKKSARVGKQA